MSIKIEREIIHPYKPRNYSSRINNDDILYKSKVIINNSTSKAMYSFPLTIRFKKDEVDNSTFFYDMPSSLSTRGTSIGYGKKSNILLSRKGKSDNIYNLPMGFNLNDRDGTPKYTFGYGRDICKTPNMLKPKDTPGPANYFPYKKFGQNGIHYSMSFRNKYKKDSDDFPGPGTYEFPELNSRGVYSSSGLRNSQSSKFSKTKRFSYHDWNYPGPGAYESENLIKGNGVVYNSKFKNYVGKTFGQRLKWIKDPMITPGPGAYESFSEFQGFDRKNFFKLRKKSFFKNSKCKSSCSTRANTAKTRKLMF